MTRKAGLSKQFANDSKTVETIYDNWSNAYNTDTDSWGYEAPRVASTLLAANAPTRAQVLDVGCGTGMVGLALRDLGFHDIVGVDLSEKSLDLAAKTGAYRALSSENFAELPTSLTDESFSALMCVGVMTYMSDVEAVCREFCRIVEPDGMIVLTQRTDLFDERDTQAAFERLVADETWRIVEITESQPYLPQHDEYQEIGVYYGVFQRL